MAKGGVLAGGRPQVRDRTAPSLSKYKTHQSTASKEPGSHQASFDYVKTFSLAFADEALWRRGKRSAFAVDTLLLAQAGSPLAAQNRPWEYEYTIKTAALPLALPVARPREHNTSDYDTGFQPGFYSLCVHGSLGVACCRPRPLVLPGGCRCARDHGGL